MGFVIEISEVGPPEYPLLQTLRDTIFAPFGHTSITPIAEQLADRQDLLVLIAHLEGNPVGLAVGFRRSAGVFYLNYLGVLSDYRGQGLGRQMLVRQEDFARARKYPRIEFNTFNHFPGMLRLGLTSGYVPVGVEQHEMTQNDLAIRFAKQLVGENFTGGKARRRSSVDEIRILAGDTKSLAQAIAQGMLIVGLVRNADDNQLQVILASSAASAGPAQPDP